MSNLTPRGIRLIKKRIAGIINNLPEIPDASKPGVAADTFRIYNETEHSGYSTEKDIKTIIYLLCEERGIIISAYKPTVKRLIFFRAHTGIARPSVSTLIDLGLRRIDPDMTNYEFTVMRRHATEHLSPNGRSPRIRAAAAIYMVYQYEYSYRYVTQKELSEIFNVSEVSIRAAMRELDGV